ncbi:MAG: hypothetical protein UX13_C0038G0005 [Candidatus Woesebacteria bacterium GW2011_GWB1_45_5]|uniref:EamA domain-containing protein n=1 Tax=Candidatus Woesebacteria bacterium GW2011_GWB1_45_5 TaxID=1618581 RepID=A0A0G1PVM1_9BACT|nr:MAG: hypothetical protein UX13_C0038G0005 [Candidatus Woesebacteria bacterium GW2011_GWB1_45_5]
MIWVYWAASSVVFFSFLSLLQRIISIDSKHPRAMSIVFNICGAIIAFLIFLAGGSYKNFALPQMPEAWIFILIASAMYGLFERWRFLASKLLEASVYSIISNIAVVIAFTGSVFLYSESLNLTNLAGVGMVILALILIGTAGGIHKKISLKGLGVGVVVSVFLGLGWMLDKKGALYFNAATYSMLIWIIPMIFVFFPYIKIKEIKYEAGRGLWKIVLLAAINVVGYLLMLKGLETGDATRIIPIVQTSSVVTVILGIFLLMRKRTYGEKDNFFNHCDSRCLFADSRISYFDLFLKILLKRKERKGTVFL